MGVIKKGFTLAEVLITLGIIGVIAAMTIPTLISNYQKAQTVTQYKKAYSEITQALKMAEVENGSMDTWDLPGTGITQTNSFADNYFYPNLKLLKKCSQGESGCWKDAISLDNTAGYLAISASDSISAVTVSGYSIFLWASGPPNQVQIWIDINGPNKGRSMLSKDIFGLMVFLTNEAGNKQGVFPRGTGAIPTTTRNQLITDTASGCSKSASGYLAGRFCGGVIALDGWAISDDYPWN